jgi:ADP-ribose pyrophosphatase YjhB (NUDIX family)
MRSPPPYINANLELDVCITSFISSSMMKEHATRSSAVYVVLKKDGHLLFHRRRHLGYPEESIIDALQREIREGLGADLRAEDTRIVHVRHRNADDGSQLDFFYTASAWDGDVQAKEPERNSELVWLKKDTLTTDVIPYIKNVLDSLDRGLSPTKEGLSS